MSSNRQSVSRGQPAIFGDSRPQLFKSFSLNVDVLSDRAQDVLVHAPPTRIWIGDEMDKLVGVEGVVVDMTATSHPNSRPVLQEQAINQQQPAHQKHERNITAEKLSERAVAESVDKNPARASVKAVERPLSASIAKEPLTTAAKNHVAENASKPADSPVNNRRGSLLTTSNNGVVPFAEPSNPQSEWLRKRQEWFAQQQAEAAQRRMIQSSESGVLQRQPNGAQQQPVMTQDQAFTQQHRQVLPNNPVGQQQLPFHRQSHNTRSDGISSGNSPSIPSNGRLGPVSQNNPSASPQFQLNTQFQPNNPQFQPNGVQFQQSTTQAPPEVQPHRVRTTSLTNRDMVVQYVEPMKFQYTSRATVLPSPPTDSHPVMPTPPDPSAGQAQYFKVYPIDPSHAGELLRYGLPLRKDGNGNFLFVAPFPPPPSGVPPSPQMVEFLQQNQPPLYGHLPPPQSQRAQPTQPPPMAHPPGGPPKQLSAQSSPNLSHTDRNFISHNRSNSDPELVQTAARRPESKPQYEVPVTKLSPVAAPSNSSTSNILQKPMALEKAKSDNAVGPANLPQRPKALEKPKPENVSGAEELTELETADNSVEDVSIDLPASPRSAAKYSDSTKSVAREGGIQHPQQDEQESTIQSSRIVSARSEEQAPAPSQWKKDFENEKSSEARMKSLPTNESVSVVSSHEEQNKLLPRIDASVKAVDSQAQQDSAQDVADAEVVAIHNVQESTRRKSLDDQRRKTSQDGVRRNFLSEEHKRQKVSENLRRIRRDAEMARRKIEEQKREISRREYEAAAEKRVVSPNMGNRTPPLAPFASESDRSPPPIPQREDTPPLAELPQGSKQQSAPEISRHPSLEEFLQQTRPSTPKSLWERQRQHMELALRKQQERRELKKKQEQERRKEEEAKKSQQASGGATASDRLPGPSSKAAEDTPNLEALDPAEPPSGPPSISASKEAFKESVNGDGSVVIEILDDDETGESTEDAIVQNLQAQPQLSTKEPRKKSAAEIAPSTQQPKEAVSVFYDPEIDDWEPPSLAIDDDNDSEDDTPLSKRARHSSSGEPAASSSAPKDRSKFAREFRKLQSPSLEIAAGPRKRKRTGEWWKGSSSSTTTTGTN